MKVTAAGTVPDFHRIPLLHNPDANIIKKPDTGHPRVFTLSSAWQGKHAQNSQNIDKQHFTITPHFYPDAEISG